MCLAQNVSCSRTQHGDACGVRTHDLSIQSPTLYRYATGLPNTTCGRKKKSSFINIKMRMESWIIKGDMIQQLKQVIGDTVLQIIQNYENLSMQYSEKKNWLKKMKFFTKKKLISFLFLLKT